MQYFKNIEIAKLHSVSRQAVSKWISTARRGKLDLQLYEEDGKYYIANTEKNRVKIENMVAENRKYRTTLTHKTLEPQPEFYERYSPRQVRDIIANLKTHHELPLQYSYFDGGASYWDGYANQSLDSESPNMLTSSIQLLASNLSSIDSLIGDRKRVNVVDIGVGNGLSVKDLLAYLLKRGVLNRYIGVDISRDMLQIAERNIKEWFNGKVAFESCICDITREGFDELLVEGILDDDEPPMNLVLVLGGTFNNLRVPDDALRIINYSMWPSDVLIYSTKLDTPNSRRLFNFNVEGDLHPLASNHRVLPELLNIDEEFYDVEHLFDEQKKARLIRIRLKVAISLRFTIDQATYWVRLNKGDTLLVWRAWHQDTLDVVNQFDRTGFNLLQAGLTEDYEYLLMIERVKSDFE